MSAPARQAPVDAYPCPQCGADTVLQPGTDSLVCRHCGALTKIAATGGSVQERDFRTALQRILTKPATELAVGAREVMCKNCGARTIVTKQSTRCPFCDESMVVEVPNADATIVPESVLPFGLDQARAGAEFQSRLKSRWFAPFGLVKRAKADGLDGVYLPYWTYDAQTTTHYRGERGEYYYVTEHYKDSQGKDQTREVRHTRWHDTSGTVRVPFDDVLVCATPTLPVALIEELEPWDLPSLKPYDGRFLAGFTTERASMDVEGGFSLAKVKMEPPIESAIKSDIGGDEQRISSKSTDYTSQTFKHVLLPLWISSFRYNDKLFRITVNARTGEVSGERPWSVLKITALVIVIAALLVGIWILATR